VVFGSVKRPYWRFWPSFAASWDPRVAPIRIFQNFLTPKLEVESLIVAVDERFLGEPVRTVKPLGPITFSFTELPGKCVLASDTCRLFLSHLVGLLAANHKRLWITKKARTDSCSFAMFAVSM